MKQDLLPPVEPPVADEDPAPRPPRRLPEASRRDFSGGTAGPRTSPARLLTAVIDAAFVVLAVYLAMLLRLGGQAGDGIQLFVRFTGGTTALVGATLIAGYLVGLYDLEPRFRRLNTVLRVIAAILSALAAASVLYYWAPWWELWRSVQVNYLVAASVLLVGWRLTAWRWVTRATPLIRCLLVGDDQESALAEELQEHPWVRFEVTRHVSPGELPAESDHLLRLCREAEVTDIVCGARVDEILARQLLICKGRGILTHRLVSVFRSATGRLPVHFIRPDEIALGPSFSRRSSNLLKVTHRSMDLLVSSACLLLSAPIHLLAALAILLESGRPVIYRQERVGRDGVPFTLYKLRTMSRNAESEGPRWASEGDERTTRVGRFLRRTRIDELPQFYNVLQGRMSIIGPRPERPFFVSKLQQTIPFYPLRHSVRPGLTGWAQVNHGYGASVEDSLRKLEYDLYYIQEGSLMLDVAVLLRTLRTVIARPGS